MAQHESDFHRAGKSALAAACLAAGLPVRTEAAGRDWRADVLVGGPRGPVAFEVQVSAVPLAELVRRQARYARDGIRGWWLCAAAPAGHAPRADLPVVRLCADAQAAAPIGDDAAPGARWPLRDWAPAVVAGAVAFRARVSAAPAQLVELAFHRARCPSCRAVNHVFAAPRAYLSACGLAFRPDSGGDLPEQVARARFRPELAAAVAALRADPTARRLLVPQPRVVDDGRGRPYRAWGCAMCARPLPHVVFRDAARAALDGHAREVAQVRVAGCGAAAPRPHWCWPGSCAT